MKKLIVGLLSLTLIGGAATVAASAEETKPAAEAATPHYPLKEPREQHWSFSGPFGYYDKAQLQRGLKVYTEVCSACHSMKLVAYRTLGDLGYTEAQVKAFAANYEVQDGRTLRVRCSLVRRFRLTTSTRRSRTTKRQRRRTAVPCRLTCRCLPRRAKSSAVSRSSFSISSRSIRKAARIISIRC